MNSIKQNIAGAALALALVGGVAIAGAQVKSKPALTIQKQPPSSLNEPSDLIPIIISTPIVQTSTTTERSIRNQIAQKQKIIALLQSQIDSLQATLDSINAL